MPGVVVHTFDPRTQRFSANYYANIITWTNRLTSKIKFLRVGQNSEDTSSPSCLLELSVSHHYADGAVCVITLFDVTVSGILFLPLCPMVKA